MKSFVYFKLICTANTKQFFSSSFPSTYFQLYFFYARQRGKGGGNCEVGLPFESEINNFSLHLGRQTNCRINSKSQLAGQGKGKKNTECEGAGKCWEGEGAASSSNIINFLKSKQNLTERELKTTAVNEYSLSASCKGG